jgi:hypothetical protein
MEQSKCRSCGADITWIRMAATGNLMPLDSAPCEDGTIAIKDGLGVTMHGGLFDEMVEGPFYRSHFSSCSSPEVHRKKKKGGKE